MTENRDLEWPGCVNVRHLGGLRTGDGRVTVPGAVVRADHPRHLTDTGWSCLWDYGIRTVVSLETEHADPEQDRRSNQRIDLREHCRGLTGVHELIEDGNDSEFMASWADTGLWCTPLYFAEALDRWPDRYARAVASVARARPGGVLIHCGAGRDRTGIITLLLLAGVGVAPGDIAADYALSFQRLESRDPGCQQRVTDLLTERGTTVPEVIGTVLDALDPQEYLCRGGLGDDDLTALRDRLTVPADRPDRPSRPGPATNARD